MNVVGKILVVLILVFALVTGGFLLVDYNTRTNWKKAYDELKREMQVTGVNSQTMADQYVGRINELKNLQTKLDKAQQDRNEDKIRFEVEFADKAMKIEELDGKAKNAVLAAKTAHAGVARLMEENKGLAASIATREKTILRIEEDNRNLRAQAIANENLSKAFQVRNESLLEQVKDLQTKLAKLESGKSGGGLADLPTDPNRPNPPSVYVKGQIEKVDGKDGLVEISIGSDQGLKKYNTLEVYRLSPKAEYLGTLRVVEVYNHKAVGRLIRNTFTTRSPVRMGDQVASSLERP
ncbi:MAG TPA: hypothetical protein VKE98_10260 [Gemmataceae bacterium]|nr:hypothetical protein [Gemmataceae bacterium]